MKPFKTLLTQLLVISSLMLPWATSAALETFEQAGAISGLGYDKFTVRGQDYRFAPGALLQSNDNKRKKFSDFRQGDQIYFKGKVLSGVNYVDIIYYQTPEPS